MNTFYISYKGGSFLFPIKGADKYAVECLNEGIHCKISGKDGFEISVDPNYSSREKMLLIQYYHPRLGTKLLTVNQSKYKDFPIKNTKGVLNIYEAEVSKNGGVVTVFTNAPSECIDGGGCSVYKFKNCFNVSVPRTLYVKKYEVVFLIAGTNKTLIINGNAKAPENPTISLQYNSTVEASSTSSQITVNSSNAKYISYNIISGNVTCEKQNSSTYIIKYNANSSESLTNKYLVEFVATGITGKTATATATITLKVKEKTIVPVVNNVTYHAFYGATDVFPNTPEIIMGDKHAVISNTGQTLTMATNKKSDYFLFTAIPSDKYDVSSWTDALGTNIFKNFSDPEFTSQVVINVKLSSDKYDLDVVNYKVYILGYDGDPLCETVNKSTIYKIK